MKMKMFAIPFYFTMKKVKKHKWFAVNEDLQHAIEDYMKERKTWKRNEPLLKSQKRNKIYYETTCVVHFKQSCKRSWIRRD